MSMERLASGAAQGGALTDFAEYRRRAAGRSRLRLRHGLLLVAGLIGGAILARNGSQAPVAAPVSGPSHFAFVANDRLAPMVSFSPPEAIRAPLHYQARIRENSGERWDTLTFGDAGGDEILFRVSLRAAKPAFFSTERGPVEWAEVTLSGAKGERACLGFRLDRVQDVDLSGLACGAHGAAFDRPTLARLIDRLAATGSGMEAGLGEVLKSGAT